MNNTQEFVYKGYFEGLNKHDKAVHILKKNGQSEPYYMFKITSTRRKEIYKTRN